MVLFAHVHFPGDDGLALRTLKGRAGFLGVQAFFVLSGFLITTLALREVERTGRLSLRSFYLRRALRILPAYLAFLAVVAGLQLAGLASLETGSWLALGTYMVNFLPGPLPLEAAHVWSLSVEEHFYLFWPFLLCVLSATGCWRAALGGIGVAFGLRWLCLAADTASGLDLWTFTRLDDVAVGCLLALAAREPAWLARLDHLASGRRLALAAGAFAAGQLCLSRTVAPRLFPPPLAPAAVALANTVNAGCLAVFLWAALRHTETWPGRLLNRRVVVGLGLLSYSLYLWHPLFLCPRLGWLASFPQNLGAIFLTALTSYWLIEWPVLSWKDRLEGRRPRTAGRESPAQVRNPSSETGKPVVSHQGLFDWAAGQPGCSDGDGNGGGDGHGRPRPYHQLSPPQLPVRLNR
jgi:peptidoglycan/LPS O-acetylase OafA/YrhL